MASSKTQLECCICTEEYNRTTHRPRGLPCLHNFCSPCLQTCITQGRTECSICRKPYTAARVEDIPINNALEEIIEMYLQMEINSVRTKESNDDGEEDFTTGNCSKHRKCLCYFKCETHGIYICRECTIVEHPSHRCRIIEIKEEIMKEKEETLNDAQQSIAYLDSTTAKLEKIVNEKKCAITNIQEQIQVLLTKVEKEREAKDQVEKQLNDNMSTSRQIKEHIRSLQQAQTMNKINKECGGLQDKVKSLKEMLTTLNNEFENEELQLQFQIPSLMSNQSAAPIVYLDLQAQGQQLGRIRIRLSCGPQRRQQMVRLCSGTGGATLQGRSFDWAERVGSTGEYIACSGYLRSDGSRASAFTVPGPVEQEQCKMFVAGAVTGLSDHTSFWICTTTDASATRMQPELGQVITGLDILSQALRKYTTGGLFCSAEQIKIVECGVEMPN